MTDWHQGAKLAPATNEMQSRDPHEFARRYGPDAAALHHALDCAQEVIEAWRDVARAGTGLELDIARLREVEAKLHLEAALDAMRSTPR